MQKFASYIWVRKNPQLINYEVSLCIYTESFICEFLFVSVEILKCKICIYQITALGHFISSSFATGEVKGVNYFPSQANDQFEKRCYR